VQLTPVLPQAHTFKYVAIKLLIDFMIGVKAIFDSSAYRIIDVIVKLWAFTKILLVLFRIPAMIPWACIPVYSSIYCAFMLMVAFRLWKMSRDIIRVEAWYLNRLKRTDRHQI
jgi:hypothetical protein